MVEINFPLYSSFISFRRLICTLFLVVFKKFSVFHNTTLVVALVFRLAGWGLKHRIRSRSDHSYAYRSIQLFAVFTVHSSAEMQILQGSFAPRRGTAPPSTCSTCIIISRLQVYAALAFNHGYKCDMQMKGRYNGTFVREPLQNPFFSTWGTKFICATPWKCLFWNILYLPCSFLSCFPFFLHY